MQHAAERVERPGESQEGRKKRTLLTAMTFMSTRDPLRDALPSRPGWGSLGFRIVLLLLPGSQIAVWHFRDLLFALVLFCHTYQSQGVIQCYSLF